MNNKQHKWSITYNNCLNMDFLPHNCFKLDNNGLINCYNGKNIIYYKIANNECICIIITRNNSYNDIQNMSTHILKISNLLLNNVYVNFNFNKYINDITCINNISIAVMIENKKYYGVHLLKQILKLHIVNKVFCVMKITNIKSIKKLQKYRMKRKCSLYNGSYLFSF